MATVLIVDDEKDIVSALKIYLRPEGYDLLEAYTGLEALEIVKNRPVDLVLMDVVMKDGSAAAPLPRVGSAPSHFDEFAGCCLDGGRARSDFAWTTCMTDAILLGGVAERLPGRRHVWDDVSKSFDTCEATALLKSAYREGWDLPQAT